MRQFVVVLMGLGAVLALAADGMTVGQAQKANPPALQPLIAKLHDKVDNVRFEAALSLGRLGEQAQPAVGELAKLLKDPNPNVRMAAAQALQAIGPAAKAAIPALVEALNDTTMTNTSFPVWVPVCVALGKIGPESVPLLIATLEKPDKQARVAAANTLGAIGPSAKAAVGPLVAILEKNDPETRNAMMAGLIGIGPEAKAAVPVLIRMLDSNDFHTQYWAQRALAKIGPEAKPAVPKLIELIHKGVVSVRRHSAIALGDIGPGIGPDGLDALVEAIGDRMEPVREDAVVALGKLGDFAKPAAPAVRKVLETRRIVARAAAASTLWILTHDAEAAVPVLIESLDDLNQATAAAEALGKIGPAAKKAVPALSVTVVKGEPEARAAALKAIEQITSEAQKKAKP